jgi:hypothetical protein
MALSENVVQSVSEANFKNLADGAAFAINLSYQDAVAHQRAVNSLREASLGAALKGLVELDPSQALSQVKALSGNDLAGQLLQLLSALGGGQQAAKVSQSTPPETAQPK